MRDREEKFYDDLLDAALRGYTAEPRAGLEHRVLAGVRERQARRWWSFPLHWQFAGVAAAAFVVLTVGIVAVQSRRVQPAETMAARAPVDIPNRNSLAKMGDAPRVLAESQPVRKPALHHQAPTLQTVAVSAPKLAVFPTPTPLSPQERLLAKLVDSTDPRLLQAMAAANQAPVQELSIKELTVDPLPTPESVSDTPPRPRN